MSNSIDESSYYFEEKVETNLFILSTSFFLVFNLAFDLLLSTQFSFILPDAIRKFKITDQSDEELKLFPKLFHLDLMNEHKKVLKKRNSPFSLTNSLLTNAILSGNVIAEWKTTILSTIQLLTTGLYSSSFMYLNPNLLANPINYRLNSSNITLLLLYALKTGYLIYKIIGFVIRFSGDNSAGLIITHLIYILLIIEAISSNQYFTFVTFGYLNDIQGFFHFLKRAFIFIQLTDCPPYYWCNTFNLILIIFLRPYVHYHQFNWLYKVYNYNKDYFWFIAFLNTSLQCLDTLFYLFDYFHLLIALFQDIHIRATVPLFSSDESLRNNEPVFTKLRRYDSDNLIAYFFNKTKNI